MRVVAGRYFDRHRGVRRQPGWTMPYWLVLPQWLSGRLGGPGRSVVQDILWGQYCLFASIRMQDDVVDRHEPCAALVFVANAFLVEAERAFARHVRDEAFWTFFRQALDQTADGILEVDALQRRRRGPIEPILDAYTRVAAIFKVGSAAICLPRKRHADFARVGEFADHLAIAGQLVDDLEDMSEDWSDGRWNVAARVVVGPPPPKAVGANQRIARAIVADRKPAEVLTLIEHHLAAAASVVAPLRMPGARRYEQHLAADLLRIRRALHRARVRAIFQRRDE